MQGLRTLVLATKIIKEQEYQEWNGHYSLAASSLEDREARIAAEAEKIERGLELVGVTAIEDKLQEGVPQAINSLITANIKVPEPCLICVQGQCRFCTTQIAPLLEVAAVRHRLGHQMGPDLRHECNPVLSLKQQCVALCCGR